MTNHEKIIELNKIWIDNYNTNKALLHLEAFSADVIASLTLAQNYDLKKVAYDIDLVLRKIGHLPDEED
jgi:hypothetical protein